MIRQTAPFNRIHSYNKDGFHIPMDGHTKPQEPFKYHLGENTDPPEPYQLEDLELLYNQSVTHKLGGSANWSEMGAKKTTTGLWLIQRLVQEQQLKNPSVLIIAPRSGKGTFYKWVPEILPEFTIIDVGSQGLSIVKDGKVIRLPPSKLKYLPAEFDFPVVVIAHYQIFSRSNKGMFKEDENGMPLRDEDGGMIMAEPNQADHVVNRPWTFYWLDEAHRIKDKNTKWTEVLKRVKADYKHVTTGTGFINRPQEIWSPLNLIDSEAFGSYWAFHDLYCEIDDSEGYQRVTGVKPEMRADLRERIRNYGPRRTLDEVMPHIKQPIQVTREVELNPTQRKMYDEIKMQLYTLDKQGVPIHAANVLSLLQRLRAICVATPEVVADYYDEKQDRRVQKVQLTEPSSKLDDVMEIIEGLQWDDDAKQQLVIFSNFVGPLKLLEARFNKSNQAAMDMGIEPDLPYLWLKQQDDDETRYRKWAELFPSMEYRIFMSTLQLGGESISLTTARHVVFLDRSWSPKDNSQGVGRIRRPGQTGQPVVINIEAKDTTDQYIRDVNAVKHGWFMEIFGDDE